MWVPTTYTEPWVWQVPFPKNVASGGGLPAATQSLGIDTDDDIKSSETETSFEKPAVISVDIADRPFGCDKHLVDAEAGVFQRV